MKDLIFDLKVFHKWVGHNLIKSFIKISAIALSVSLLWAILNLLITATVIPLFLIAFLPSTIVFASIVSYFIMFLDDRGTIKEVKKEIHMERKYQSLFSKFNKTF